MQQTSMDFRGAACLVAAPCTMRYPVFKPHFCLLGSLVFDLFAPLALLSELLAVINAKDFLGRTD